MGFDTSISLIPTHHSHFPPPFIFPFLSSTARLSKRTRMVRDLVGEVVGMAPYEKRLLDMLKTGGASSEKRMYKFAKRRLGTHKRAMKKRDQIKETYGKMRAKA